MCRRGSILPIAQSQFVVHNQQVILLKALLNWWQNDWNFTVIPAIKKSLVKQRVLGAFEKKM
jgi:hypothetical protein